MIKKMFLGSIGSSRSKNLIKIAILGIFVTTALGMSRSAFAQSLYLSANSQGSGTVSLSLSGANPYSQVTLYEQPSGSSLWTVISNFGQTDQNGNLNVTTSLGNSNSNGTINIYATVNGWQSNTVSVYANGSSGCGSGSNSCCVYNNNNSYSNCNNGSISLSQSSVTVNQGQSTTVTAYNNYNNSSNNIYISSNTNSSVASANVSGNTITVYGNGSGSDTITVCSYNNGCASLYVTVGYNSGCSSNCGIGSFSLSQTTVSLNLGQSTTVTASNYYGGSIYISNNSNQSVVAASASGNTVSLSAEELGSSTVTVCTNSYNTCASIYVTVNSNGSSGGSISFSQSNVNVSIGQSSSVNIFGNSSYYNSYNSYYISSNTNSSVVSATVNGSLLYITGQNSGIATLTVCQYNGSCGSLQVTVGGNNNVGGSLSFSQSNVSLGTGQTTTVTVYNNNNYNSSNYYISSNSNSSVVSATVNGNAISLYGENSGSSTITVCSNNSSQCGYLSVSINGSNNCYQYNSCTTGSLSLSQSNVNLGSGQTTTVTIYNNNSFYNYSNYYISSNTNSSVVSATVSGNSVYLTAGNSGSSTLSICQNSYSSCGTIYVTVNGNGNFNSSSYANGALVNMNGTVYIVYKNTISGFASAWVFQSLGFSFNNVTPVGYSTNLQNSGRTIANASAAHPWGSWVKSGTTVYFVDQSGLIPVPDYGTFLNNGGQDAWVVPANSWDFQLPMLSAMTYNDNRLQ